MSQKPEPETVNGVDALEKLAYLIAEEFVAESKRAMTKELLTANPDANGHDDLPKVRRAGGAS